MRCGGTLLFGIRASFSGFEMVFHSYAGIPAGRLLPLMMRMPHVPKVYLLPAQSSMCRGPVGPRLLHHQRPLEHRICAQLSLPMASWRHHILALRVPATCCSVGQYSGSNGIVVPEFGSTTLFCMRGGIYCQAHEHHVLGLDRHNLSDPTRGDPYFIFLWGKGGANEDTKVGSWNGVHQLSI